MQLVLGSYAIAMSTALLPTMSHQAAAGQYRRNETHVRVFAEDRLIHRDTGGGGTGSAATADHSGAVSAREVRGGFHGADRPTRYSYYSLGLPAFAAIKLITPMYYSTQDTMTPARVGAWALGMNIGLNSIFLLFFFRHLSNGSPALASAITAYFNFGLLFFLFRKQYGRLGARGLAAFARKDGGLRCGDGRQWHTRD